MNENGNGSAPALPSSSQRDAVMASLSELQTAFHSFQSRHAADVQRLRAAKEAAEQEAATLRFKLQRAEREVEQLGRTSLVVPIQPAGPAPHAPRRHMADMEADVVLQRSVASMGRHPGVAASGEALPLQPLAVRSNVGFCPAPSLSPGKQQQAGAEQGGWAPGYLSKFPVRRGSAGSSSSVEGLVGGGWGRTDEGRHAQLFVVKL